MPDIQTALSSIHEYLARPNKNADKMLLEHYLAGFHVHTPIGELVTYREGATPVLEQALLWELAWRRDRDIARGPAFIASDESQPRELPPRHSNPFFDPQNGLTEQLQAELDHARGLPATVGLAEFLSLGWGIERRSDWPKAEQACAVVSGEGRAATDTGVRAQELISRAIFRGEPDVVIRCAKAVMTGLNKTERFLDEFIDDVLPILLLCYCRIWSSPEGLIEEIEGHLPHPLRELFGRDSPVGRPGARVRRRPMNSTTWLFRRGGMSLYRRGGFLHLARSSGR